MDRAREARASLPQPITAHAPRGRGPAADPCGPTSRRLHPFGTDETPPTRNGKVYGDGPVERRITQYGPGGADERCTTHANVGRTEGCHQPAAASNVLEGLRPLPEGSAAVQREGITERSERREKRMCC